MKILLIPLNYEDKEHHREFLVNFNNHSNSLLYTNKEEAIKFKADVIFYQGGLSIEDCLEIKQNSKWITWTGDFRFTPMQYLIDVSSFTDKYILPFTGIYLKQYSKILKKPCLFLWEYFQDSKIIPPKQMDSGDIVFVGNVYDHLPGGKERIDLAEFIGKHFEVNLYGEFPLINHGNKKGSIENKLVPELYNNSYITIVENNWSNIPDYFTPRNLTAMSAGSCAVMKWFPNIEDHFENFKHCVYYKSKYELLDVISYLQKNPSERNRIAKEGYSHVIKNYSLNIFVKTFLSKI